MLLIECDIVHLRRSTLVTTETFSTSNGASHLDDVLGYQLRCIRDPFNHISSVKCLRGVSTVQEPRTSTHCMCMQNFNKRKERFLHFFFPFPVSCDHDDMGVCPSIYRPYEYPYRCHHTTNMYRNDTLDVVLHQRYLRMVLTNRPPNTGVGVLLHDSIIRS